METRRTQNLKYGTWLVSFLLGVWLGNVIPKAVTSCTQWFRTTVAESCWAALIQLERVKAQYGSTPILLQDEESN